MIENISRVEIHENGELHLVLNSGGSSDYQYIFREAAGVYWDKTNKSFKSPKPRDWSYCDWFKQIHSVVAILGIKLNLTNQTQWVNVKESDKAEILNFESSN